MVEILYLMLGRKIGLCGHKQAGWPGLAHLVVKACSILEGGGIGLVIQKECNITVVTKGRRAEHVCIGPGHSEFA